MKPSTIERALTLATPQQLASALGSRTSEAKKAAAKLNGLKGGRPKKSVERQK